MADRGIEEQWSERFRNLAAFVLCMLPGWHWKLPVTLLIGFGEIAILILVPLVGARIIDALKAGDWEHFRCSLVTLAVLTLAQTIVSLAHRYVCLRLDERVGNSLRRTIVDMVFRKEIQFFERHWLGDIVSRAINDTAALKSFLTGILLQIIYDGVTLVIVVMVLVLMNPVLAVLTIATAPGTLLYGHFVRPRLEAATMRVRENVAALMGHLQSWLSRPFALKVHSLESVALRRFALKNDDLTTNAVRFGTLGALVGAISATLLHIPSLVIFAYGGYTTLTGRLSIGELFAFMTFSSYFNAPIQRLIGILVATLPTLYPIHHRIQEFLAPDDVETTLEDYSPTWVAGIRATRLNFSFENQGGFRLIVPSFVARRGEVVGITGPNGSGKSTLAWLLMGIYQSRTGEVRLNSDNQQGHPASGRRRLFAFLPQELALFDGTLQENVTLFDANPDLARLTRIAEELDLASWIASLPQGWETEVNAGLATTFSSGQIQKIGLARLLYRESPILLLDEPASGLDEVAREAVKRILRRSRADRIVIIITHSRDTLALCDRIYRLRPLPDEPRVYECVEEAVREESLRNLFCS